MAELTFIGAVQEVTGSCHLLQTGDRTILLDCGMHQGGDATDRLRRERFAFNPRRIDCVVLSHAHLDHSGLLPRLVSKGFDGAIYCTQGTFRLLKILLEDAAGIYLRDLEHDNIQRRRAGQKPLVPLYTENDVARVIQCCKPLHYDEMNEIMPWINLRFYDAGHILGSAIVELTIAEDDKQKVLVFSGDLGNPDTSLMRHYDYVKNADVVLLESTYGDRNHRAMNETLDEFRQLLNTAKAEDGNILIPSFAVGRTQELLFHLGRFYQEGLLDDWQVYLDSPMGSAVTEVYAHCMGQLNPEDVAVITGNGHGHENLKTFLPNLTITESVEQSMAINKIKQRAIIIAGSGMCTGGRIRHHFKHRLWSENNHVVFVGFQAAGTLGRLLVNGVEKIKLFRQWIAVKAQIHTLGGFSAHAGQRHLLDWTDAFNDSARIYLVHGEPESMQALVKAMAKHLKRKAVIPEKGQVITF